MKKESVRVCIVNVCIHSKPWEEGDSKGVKNRLTAGTKTDRIIYNSDEISSQRMDADRHGRFFWKHVHNNISACAWMCVFLLTLVCIVLDFELQLAGVGLHPVHMALQVLLLLLMSVFKFDELLHTHTNTVLLDSLTLNAKHNKAGDQQSDLVWCLFCNTKKKTPFLNLGVLFLHDSNETKWGILPHCKMHVWNSNLVTVFRIKTLL